MTDSDAHFVSMYCDGRKCGICLEAATHKVAEEVFDDDPDKNRHPLTSYVCCKCFRKIMGQAATCPADATGQP